MSHKCIGCSEDLPYASVTCPLCGEPAGFPNVRAANDDGEIEALRARVRDALISAEARHCRPELEEFGLAVESSVAVVTMKLIPLSSLVLHENAMLASFHMLVGAGARLPEHNEFDAVRVAMDSKVNPFDVHKQISYAALSLDGVGVSWYGDFFVSLSEESVKKRASVFEENPFTFCDKHGVSITRPMPLGYRASWSRRPELAMAKLHSKIEPGMDEAAFPSVLLEQGSNSDLTDFIEVHIFGPVHPKAVTRVIAKMPKDRSEQLIWKKVSKRLSDMGVIVEAV